MSGSPDDLDDLERKLQAMRFEPRASLGAEIAGRVRRGEQAVTPAPRTSRVRRILGLAAGFSIVVAGLVIAGVIVTGGRASTVDRCCQDLDGGGDADDGLVVTAERGQRVDRLAIYEDLDGSRSFSLGDRIRFERRGAPALSGPLGTNVRTVEFCCVDYDGGGASDDALMVVGRAPDLISMAAIYEHGGAPGEPRTLR